MLVPFRTNSAKAQLPLFHLLQNSVLDAMAILPKDTCANRTTVGYKRPIPPPTLPPPPVSLGSSSPRFGRGKLTQ